MSYITSYISDASEKVRDKAKIILNTLKQTLSQKSLEKLIRTTWNDQQEKRISGFYSFSDRSILSEASTSRISFIKDKPSRRNILSFYNAPVSTKSELSSNYPLYEISEAPRRKRDRSEMQVFKNQKLN